MTRAIADPQAIRCDDPRVARVGAIVRSAATEADAVALAAAIMIPSGAALMPTSDQRRPAWLTAQRPPTERSGADVLVAASRGRAASGTVSVDRRTHRVLEDLPCAVAIAPRAWSSRSEPQLRRIGVGYPREPGACRSLSVAAALAQGSGAELVVRGIVDDRAPSLAFPGMWVGPLKDAWRELMDDAADAARDAIDVTVAELEIQADVGIMRGPAASSLLAITSTVDLLVVGLRSRRALARHSLGPWAEALIHGASCALLFVPGADPR